MKNGIVLVTTVLLGGLPIIAGAAQPSLYGKVNLSLENIDFEGASLAGPRVADEWELNSNNSRIGIKGDFDLDVGNLKAVYLAEFGIDVDEGDSGGQTFSQRNIYAGLQGAYGTVIAGKFDTPLKRIEGPVDQFNDLYGDLDTFIGGQNRSSNIIQYQTPLLWNGLTVKAAFSPAEQDDVDGDGVDEDGLADTVSASLEWQRERLYAALAYEKDQAARRSVDGIDRADLLRASLSYRLGALELGALVQQAEDAAPNSDLEDRSLLASSAWHFERLTLKAQGGRTKGEETGEKLTLWALGADYRLGSGTVAYVYLSQLERDDAGTEDRAAGTGLAFKF
ncbi:porin [Alloalcanivorax sp. C16-1]|uniref:porin n=1 Tax=Alloalcanivorax sp. C16-1 TaxID=3390051 RepID=UPI003970C93B